MNYESRIMNVQQSLEISTKKLKQKNILSSALDAEVLLLEALNRVRIYFKENDIRKCRLRFCNDNKKLDRSWLYTNNNYELTKKEEKLFNSFINQRLKNKPVAYIINKKEFFGYDFYVDENVLIPRPETELIVEEVLKILHRSEQACLFTTMIDIGTGSGCIIISILNELAKNKNKKVIHSSYANDISQNAIEIAKVNAKKYNLTKKINFVKNNFEKFLDSLDRKNIYNSNEIIITANLPYIKNENYKTLSEDIKKYEPKIALMAGKDGLVCIEKLIESILKIKKKYKQKIYVFIEADPNQMSKIKMLLRKNFNNSIIKIIRDLSKKERIISVEIA